MKKLCTALAICLMLTNIMTVQAFAVTTSQNSITDLTLTAEDCNIIFELSADNQFHFDYESNAFDLKTEDSNSSRMIHVSKKSDVGNVWPVQFVTIQIPDSPYNQLNLNLENVGISIPAVNCNVNVEAKESAVTVNIPPDFNKTLTYRSSKGADSIKFQGEPTNVKLVLDAKESAVGMPEGWPRYEAEKSYTYQVGDATGNINAAIDGCAFRVSGAVPVLAATDEAMAITDAIITVAIPEIEANKAVCVGQIELEAAVNFRFNVISAGGQKFFVALYDSPDITQGNGIGWDQRYSTSSGTVSAKFTSQYGMGTKYVYICAQDQLKTVTGDVKIE